MTQPGHITGASVRKWFEAVATSPRLSKLNPPTDKSLDRIARLINELRVLREPSQSKAQTVDDLNKMAEIGHSLDVLMEAVPALLRRTLAANVAGDTISPALIRLLGDARIASEALFGERTVKAGPRRDPKIDAAHALSEPILEAWKSTGLRAVSYTNPDSPFLGVLCFALTAVDHKEHTREALSSVLKRHPPKAGAILFGDLPHHSDE